MLDQQKITHAPTIGSMYEGLTRNILELALKWLLPSVARERKKVKYSHENESASAYQETDERVEGRTCPHLRG